MAFIEKFMRAIISGIAANAPRGGALESESIREFLWPPPPLPLHFPGCGYRAASGWKRFFTQPLHAASSRSLVDAGAALAYDLAMKSVWTFLLFCPVLGLVAAPQGAQAPSVDQILDRYVQAVGGKDAIAKVTSRAMKGTLENSDDGTTSPAEVVAKAPNKYLSVVSLGDSGQAQEGWNGETGWGKDHDSGLHDMNKSDLVAAKRDYDFYRQIRLKELFPKMSLSGKMKVDDRDAYIVEATAADGAVEKLYFDVESGLLVRRDFERVNVDDGILLYEVDYEDYKDVDGLKLPSTVRRKTPDYALTYRFTEIKQNVAVDDARFNKPEK